MPGKRFRFLHCAYIFPWNRNFRYSTVCSLSRKLERGNFSYLEALRPRPRFREHLTSISREASSNFVNDARCNSLHCTDKNNVCRSGKWLTGMYIEVQTSCRYTKFLPEYLWLDMRLDKYLFNFKYTCGAITKRYCATWHTRKIVGNYIYLIIFIF